MKQAIRWLFSINWNFSHNVPFSIRPEGSSSDLALIKNNLANPSHKSGRLVHSASLYHFFFRTSRITFLWNILLLPIIGYIIRTRCNSRHSSTTKEAGHLLREEVRGRLCKTTKVLSVQGRDKKEYLKDGLVFYESDKI